MIKLQQFTEELHAEITKWWTDRGAMFVPMAILPKTSCVAYSENEDGTRELLAAAWVYLDNSCNFSMIAWPCVSPTAKPRLKAQGLRTVIQFLTDHTKDDLGYTFMAATPNVGSIVRMFRREGFIKVSSGGTLLGRAL